MIDHLPQVVMTTSLRDTEMEALAEAILQFKDSIIDATDHVQVQRYGHTTTRAALVPKLVLTGNTYYLELVPLNAATGLPVWISVRIHRYVAKGKSGIPIVSTTAFTELEAKDDIFNELQKNPGRKPYLRLWLDNNEYLEEQELEPKPATREGDVLDHVEGTRDD